MAYGDGIVVMNKTVDTPVTTKRKLVVEVTSGFSGNNYSMCPEEPTIGDLVTALDKKGIEDVLEFLASRNEGEDSDD